MSKMVAVFLTLPCLFLISAAQSQRVKSAEDGGHIQQLIQQLPPNSSLRRELLAGDRGNGIRYWWMDQMRKLYIRRVLVSIDIKFDHSGRPTKLSVSRVQFFKQYSDDDEITTSKDLGRIQSSGLVKQLDALALQRAMHGAWVDLPRPRPSPFTGGARVEFFDDEWLPVASAPIYFVSGRSADGVN